MMNLGFSRPLVAAVLTVSVGAALAAPLEIAGSTSVQKTIIDPVTAAARDAGIELKMLPVGTGKGMAMLFEGKVSVAAVSDELPDAVAAAAKAGANAAPANLKMVTVVVDQLVPVVHPDNTIAALSREQLKDIFSGKTTHWKAVGGADAPITVVVGAAGSGTRAVIEKQLLSGTGFASNAKELRTSSAELTEVARDRNAIGYVGAGAAESAKGKVREVKGPEIKRPLGFVTVGEPSAEVKKLYAYLQGAEVKKLFLH